MRISNASFRNQLFVFFVIVILTAGSDHNKFMDGFLPAVFKDQRTVTSGCQGIGQNRDMGYQGSSSLSQKRSHQQLGGTSEQKTLVYKKQATASYQTGPSSVMQRMYVPSPMANISNPFSSLVRPLGHPFAMGFGDHWRHGRVTTDILGKLQTHVKGSTELSGENLHTSTRIKNQISLLTVSNNRFLSGSKHPCIKFTFRGRQVERSSQNWKITASEFDKDGEGFFSIGPCLHQVQQVNIPTEPEKHNANLERTELATEPDKDGGGLKSVTRVGFSREEADTRLVLSSTAYDKNVAAVAVQPIESAYDKTNSTPAKTQRSTDHVSPDSKSNSASKAEGKKPRTAANHFPINVNSLLSTGIFDGICVKYVSWDRKKSVRGTIKGAGYLCRCKECNATKIVNAFELEMHAGCKSKHPNNHIYFPNGKNIYSVVQELRSIPSDKLPEAIRTITGSPIHEINFSTWEASFQGGYRENEQTYEKDFVNLSMHE